jgi:hypothetical protein
MVLGPWKLHLHMWAQTTSPSGRKQEMSRWFFLSPEQTVVDSVLAQLAKRKDRGYSFLGCLIVVEIGLARRLLTLEEKDGQLVLKDIPKM